MNPPPNNVVPVRRKLSASGWLRTALDSLLLRYIHFLEIGILLLGLLGGIYLVSTIWFYRPTLNLPPAQREITLSTALIDQLELWIEQRQQELQTPLNLGSRAYFEQDLNQ